MKAAPTAVHVQVPASTSNLGSGFDTLGLAVNCYLHVHATLRSESGLLIDESSSHYASAKPLIEESAAAWLDGNQGIEIRVSGDVPVGRGLGASAALRVGVIAACSFLRGANLTRQALLDRAYALEHHPDNASPALFGGFTVSGRCNNSVRCATFPVRSNLKLVTLLPPFELPTAKARKLLPETYSRSDAIHSLNRAALIVAAFASQNYASLKHLFDDVLHQPYRQKLIPELTAVIQAGEKAGAIGGFLSGAGSAIICLALHREHEVADAMQRALPSGAVRILSPDNQGCKVVPNSSAAEIF